MLPWCSPSCTAYNANAPILLLVSPNMFTLAIDALAAIAYAFAQYAFDALSAATSAAFVVALFSMASSAGCWSPSTAAQMWFCVPATCPINWPNVRTVAVAVGLYAYSASASVSSSAAIIMLAVMPFH